MKSPSPSAFRTSVTPPPRDFLNRFSFESSFWSAYEVAMSVVRAVRGVSVSDAGGERGDGRTEDAELVELAVLVGEELEGADGELAVERGDVPQEGELRRRRDRGRHRRGPALACECRGYSVGLCMRCSARYIVVVWTRSAGE